MAKRAAATKKKPARQIACKHLVQLNEISNAGNPLCRCDARGGFTISPFNMVCQICELYVPNAQDITHDQIYTAEGAEGFEINWDEISVDDDIDDDDYDSDADEFDDDLIIDKDGADEDEDEDEEEEEDEDEEEIEPREDKPKIEPGEDEEEEDEDEEEELHFEEEEEEDGIILGYEKEEKDEDLIDYEDEREEALGKKGSAIGAEDEDELEEELEELEEELGFEDEDMDFEEDEEGEDIDMDEDIPESKPAPVKRTTKASAAKDVNSTQSSTDLDFERDVLSKVKKIKASNGEMQEACPYCGKPYKVVTRHIYRCKRAPPGIEAAYEEYKKTH